MVSAAVTVLSPSFPEGEVKVSILEGGAKVDLFDKAGLLFRLDLSSSLQIIAASKYGARSSIECCLVG